MSSQPAGKLQIGHFCLPFAAGLRKLVVLDLFGTFSGPSTKWLVDQQPASLFAGGPAQVNQLGPRRAL